MSAFVRRTLLLTSRGAFISPISHVFYCFKSSEQNVIKYLKICTSYLKGGDGLVEWLGRGLASAPSEGYGSVFCQVTGKSQVQMEDSLGGITA